MGHSWREMDPGGAAESDRLQDLEGRLLRQVRAVKLKNLSIGDIMDLIEVIRPHYDMHRFSDQDAELLRRIVRRE